jgi:hypothetical protein
MFDDRKRRYCVIKSWQGIRSLAVDTNKGCMKIPVLTFRVGFMSEPRVRTRARVREQDRNSTSLQQLADPALSLRPFQHH